MGKSLGCFRASYLAALCCAGSFLFAYDTGVVGGVLTLPSFVKDFGYSASQATTVSANSTSLLQAGGKSWSFDWKGSADTIFKPSSPVFSSGHSPLDTAAAGLSPSPLASSTLVPFYRQSILTQSLVFTRHVSSAVLVLVWP